jgi:TPP-dependent pyruvate/acetoin dehydrogenase alpha subunit
MTSAEEKVHLTKAHALELMRQMVLIRRFEETCAELYSAGKIRGFLHLYIGEEANAVGVMQALGPEDAVVATYREHGHALARGLPATEIMAEMYGKASSTVAMPSWAAGCRSRSVSHSPTRCRAITASPAASSARARPPRANSTSP